MGVVRPGGLPARWAGGGPRAALESTHEQLCAEAEIPLTLPQGVQEAVGFARPVMTPNGLGSVTVN